MFTKKQFVKLGAAVVLGLSSLGGVVTATATTTQAKIVCSKYEKNDIMSSSEIKRAKSRFLKDVNTWRKKQGLRAFSTSAGWLNTGAEKRAAIDSKKELIKTNDIIHERPNGKAWYTIYPRKRKTYLRGEVLNWRDFSDETPEQLADKAFNDFVYHDAASNWGHRKVLKQRLPHPIIGIGIGVFEKEGLPIFVLLANTGNK